MSIAVQEQKLAAAYLRSVLVRSLFPTFVFSYESAMLLGPAYAEQLLAFVGEGGTANMNAVLKSSQAVSRDSLESEAKSAPPASRRLQGDKSRLRGEYIHKLGLMEIDQEYVLRPENRCRASSQVAKAMLAVRAMHHKSTIGNGVAAELNWKEPRAGTETSSSGMTSLLRPGNDANRKYT